MHPASESPSARQRYADLQTAYHIRLAQLHDEGIPRGKRKEIEEHMRKLKADLDIVRGQISLDDLLGF
jgi:hypothetical protein